MSDDRRPLVSLCLLAYNQERFVEEAVAGALAQTYEPLQVILSDDASTDGTFERMSRVAAGYVGPARVLLNRNAVNLGLGAHINLLTGHLASGELIALAAGDDVSLPDRISRSVACLAAHPDVMAVSTALTLIDEHGRELPRGGPRPSATAVYDLAGYVADPAMHVNGPSRTFRRVVADTFGPLEEGCPTEDSTYLLRCLLMGRVALLPEPLVRYRRHGGNLSAPHNIQRLSVDRIVSQYRADIATAERVVGLSTDTKAGLLARVEANARARRLRAPPVDEDKR
ncbi:MAG: glycosyltransferase [Pirellulales bacterium]